MQKIRKFCRMVFVYCISKCITPMPRLQTSKQRDIRCAMSRDNLRLFYQDPVEFLTCFVIMDQTWVHYYELDAKYQSIQWKRGFLPRERGQRSYNSPKGQCDHVLGRRLYIFSGFFCQRAKIITGSTIPH